MARDGSEWLVMDWEAPGTFQVQIGADRWSGEEDENVKKVCDQK